MTLTNSSRINSYLVYYNKEIQDHLLGEISETDNSVKALYEVRKIESKLAQRKMLGIVTTAALSQLKQFIEASETNQSLNQKALKLIQITQIVNSVVRLMIKGNVLLMAKYATIVAIKIILRSKCQSASRV